MLEKRFRDCGFDSQTMPIDLSIALNTFQEAVNKRMEEEVSKSDSPLFNFYVVQKIKNIEERLPKKRNNYDGDSIILSQSELSIVTTSRIQEFITNYSTYFAGRERDIQELNDWLHDDTERIGMLMAPMGRGKSALIRHYRE